ncbi:MAG: class I SAM-dependent methyltransferase [Anaerolineales bacterium]
MSKSAHTSNQTSEKNGRGYQHDFYDTCDRVRDRASRLEIAYKIDFILDDIMDFDTADMNCLDIGSSSGLVTTAIAHRFAQTIGLDIDQHALWERESSVRETAEFVEGDAMRLPFQASTFDFILCLQVYEHVPDDEILAAEMFRVLKPEGTVLFSGPNLLFPIEPHYHLPFLHWLPQAWADFYLRSMGKGHSYYEKSRSYWGLRRIVSDFTLHDISPDIFLYRLLQDRSLGYLDNLLKRITKWLLKATIPLMPNFNWILRKEPQDRAKDDR